MPPPKHTPMGFYSYAHEDDVTPAGAAATELRAKLERWVALRVPGFHVFQDAKNLRPGDVWEERLQSAIDGCVFFFPVLSPAFFASKPCEEETFRFLERMKTNRALVLVPLYLFKDHHFDRPVLRRKHPLRTALYDHQYSDLTAAWQQGWDTPHGRAAVMEVADTIVESIARADEEWAIAEADEPLIAAGRFTEAVKELAASQRTEEAAGSIRVEGATVGVERQPLSVRLHGVDLDLACIPAGTFRMGSLLVSGVDEESTSPQREVRITRPVWIGVFPVTQELWAAVAPEAGLAPNPSRFQGERRPVERVSWLDAVRWCNAASRMAGLVPAYDIEDGGKPGVQSVPGATGFRLPTEAEWEYVCRAGTLDEWSFGDDQTLLPDHAWAKENSGAHTHPVGEKKPNRWGLHDMHGNTWEWCLDGMDHYERIGTVDPAPVESETKVVRGGSWLDPGSRTRSGVRFAWSYRFKMSHIGFRVALSEAPRDLGIRSEGPWSPAGFFTALSACLARGRSLPSAPWDGVVDLRTHAGEWHVRTPDQRSPGAVSPGRWPGGADVIVYTGDELAWNEQMSDPAGCLELLHAGRIQTDKWVTAPLALLYWGELIALVVG